MVLASESDAEVIGERFITLEESSVGSVINNIQEAIQTS